MSETTDSTDTETTVPTDHRFESEDDAVEAAAELGLDGAHEMGVGDDTVWVPGEDPEAYAESTEEMAGSVLEAVDVYEA